MSNEPSSHNDSTEKNTPNPEQSWVSKTFAPLLPGNGMDLKSYYSCLAFMTLILIAMTAFVLSVTNFLQHPTP